MHCRAEFRIVGRFFATIPMGMRKIVENARRQCKHTFTQAQQLDDLNNIKLTRDTLKGPHAIF